MALMTNDVCLNEVRRGTYLDSVALMRMSRTVAALPGIVECGMMMATPANKRIMADAGVLDAAGEAAGPGDLVIAVRARDQAAADAGLAAARRSLDAPKIASADGAAWQPRTLRAAAAADPQATVAMISVPGAFATAEARKALNRGLNVMMFSDNVPLADEVALKQEARAKGLLVMGPDCGTAIIGGVPLAFANVVPRGDIGIIGASGTGIQEVSCLIAKSGRGVSHAIGTGGRDLKKEVGGITMLMSIDLLDADPATRHIVLISKPPAAEVASAILARVGCSTKPFTICFLGAGALSLPANARQAMTLEDAAQLALGKPLASGTDTTPMPKANGRLIRALFAGGTLCTEAQVIAHTAGADFESNIPITGGHALGSGNGRHTFLDLGDDEFTQGRPHPMIEPAVRDAPLRAALQAPEVGVVLLDIVLGFGGHADPAGHVAGILTSVPERPLVVASVTGTEGDPQHARAQIAALEQAGVRVLPSNAAATRAALRAVGVTA